MKTRLQFNQELSSQDVNMGGELHCYNPSISHLDIALRSKLILSISRPKLMLENVNHNSKQAFSTLCPPDLKCKQKTHKMRFFATPPLYIKMCIKEYYQLKNDRRLSS